MYDVSVVIPVGPGHRQIAERAIASVEAQTEPANLIVVYDDDGRGPSWARNRGLEQVKGWWVSFLDADDEILPNYVERMLAVGGSPTDYYVYSDWLEGKSHRRPPNACWCGGNEEGGWSQDEQGIFNWHGGGAWHVITSLLPTHWVKHVGGFNEGFTEGGEDTEFYWNLTHHGCCGIHISEPLFHYHLNVNGRAHDWVERNPKHKSTMQSIMKKYGGIMSGCCGQAKADTTRPSGERQEGDVLAQALWRTGKRKTVGSATRRPYPRASFPMLVWINPRDLAAMPQQFRQATPAPPPPPPPPQRTQERPLNFKELTQAVGDAIGAEPKEDAYQPVAQPAQAPSVDSVIQMGQEALGGNVPDPSQMKVKEIKAWLQDAGKGTSVDALELLHERERGAKNRPRALAAIYQSLEEAYGQEPYFA